MIANVATFFSARYSRLLVELLDGEHSFAAVALIAPP
jgi:hypothetical protein